MTIFRAVSRTSNFVCAVMPGIFQAVVAKKEDTMNKAEILVETGCLEQVFWDKSYLGEITPDMRRDMLETLSQQGQTQEDLEEIMEEFRLTKEELVEALNAMSRVELVGMEENGGGGDQARVMRVWFSDGSAACSGMSYDSSMIFKIHEGDRCSCFSACSEEE